jgi:hypothetical protein
MKIVLLMVLVLLGCSPRSKPAMEACTACGAFISVEAVSCPHCGNRLPTATQQLSKQSELSNQVFEARARIMQIESARKEHDEVAPRELLEKLGNDLDPWGNPYQYDESTNRIWSYGPDRLANTRDDIGIRRIQIGPAGVPIHSH